MIFVCDPPKRRLNLKTHALDLQDAETCDWTKAVVTPTYEGARGEDRFKAVLPFGDQLVTVVFSPLGSEAVSVISMRRASRKERRDYAGR